MEATPDSAPNGREEALIAGLTGAVVVVYGEWARPARLAAGVTDVLAELVGEQVRAGVTIDFFGQADERSATGGHLPPRS